MCFTQVFNQDNMKICFISIKRVYNELERETKIPLRMPIKDYVHVSGCIIIFKNRAGLVFPFGYRGRESGFKQRLYTHDTIKRIGR